VLDCLTYLLKKGVQVPERFVNRDMEQAKIIGQIGEWWLTEVIRLDGSVTFTVQNDAGLSPKSPKTLLDSLCNEFTFDMMPFVQMSEADKIKQIMKSLRIDFSEIDCQVMNAEQERLNATRQMKRIGQPRAVVSATHVDISESLQFNAEQDRKANVLNNSMQELSRVSEKIAELQKQLADLQDRQNHLVSEIQVLPKPEPKVDVQQRVDQNRKADEYQAYQKQQAEYNEYQAEHQAADQRIKDLRKSKIEALAGANLPEGLRLEMNGEGYTLLYDGSAAGNWSTAEAMLIAFDLFLAAKPLLQTIFIDRAELFDDRTLELIEERARLHNIQVIMTIVDAIPEEKVDGNFYLIEGELVS
jgi:cell division protein FtsB